MGVHYQNLDVVASGYQRAGTAERFEVRVAASPLGSMPASKAVAVEVQPDVRRLVALVDRRASTAADLVELGRLLGDLLLPDGPVRRRFEDCRAGVTGLGRLRLRLRFEAGALADLPWEYAYVPRADAADDDERAGFLALDKRLSIVRHHPVEGAPEALGPVEGGELRLVALLATPDDPAYPPLEVEAERKAIAGAVRQLRELDTDWVEHATPDSFGDAVSRPAHVLHFAGHGEFTTELGERLGELEGAAFLVLEDDRHRPALVSAEDVALQVTAVGIRLAVLGACHSGRRDAVNPWAGVAPAMIRTARIPAAVGMQFTIGDAAAVKFSKRLYERLAEGMAVEEAVTVGRLAVLDRARPADRDWGVPVLYLRDEGGPLFPVAPAVDWKGVAAQARATTSRVLREWRADGRGRWLADLYTSRPAVDEAFEDFLGAGERAAMVVAPSGYGKTTELAHRAGTWAEAGHAVLLLDASRWHRADAEAEICTALGIEGGLDAVAGHLEARHQLLVLVDGVSEFGDVGALVESLDGLAGRLPDHCRVVAACSQPAWDRVAQASATRGRMGAITSSRWFGSGTGQPGVVLRAFDAPEAERAFEAYGRRFRLAARWADLPPAAQAEVSVPLVLRLCAEAYEGRALPPAVTGIDLLRRLWERLTAPEREVALELARVLLEAGAATVPLSAATRSPALREAMTADAGPYAALLERGVLTEAYDPVTLTDRVGFSQSRFGAFVAGVAAHADAGGGGSPEKAVRGLVSPQAPSLAWDAARLLLARLGDPPVVARLAGDADPDLRHVAVGAVVERYAEDPAGTGRLLRSLLVGGRDQAGAWRQGSGFKATLELGGVGLEHLRWAVTHASPGLRRAAGAVVALHWERDAAFTDSVLDDLSRAIRFRQPRRARRLLEAMTEVNIPVYIAHCDDADVTERTARLWKDVLKDRLKLHLLVPKVLDRVLVPVVSTVFARRIGETAVLDEVQPASVFYSLPAAERERYLRAVPLVDPGVALGTDAVADDLVALLDSDVAPCGILGALVLAVHGYAEPDATADLFASLWKRLSPVGRLWALSAFSVLIRDPEVARAWKPRLDKATRDLAADAPAVFFGEEPSVPATLGLQALPAGLAAAKLEEPLAVLTRLGRGLRDEGTTGREAALWRSIGVLGLFHPEPVLAAAWTVIGDRPAREAAAPMAAGLGMMRVGRPDLVDRFLAEIGAGDAVRTEVAKAGDPAAVRRITYALGIYNNAVHQALHYRTMRERLLVGGLRALGESTGLGGFVRAYTPVPIAMVREAGFDLIQWTK